MPHISVVMPAYNRADTIGRAVRSVLDQDYRDFELIVVDDGSTDRTAEVMAGFGPPVLYHRLPKNGGGNAARNKGIALASGAIVCFLDSDDEFMPHKLSWIAGYFADHPAVDVLVDSFVVAGTPPVSRTNPVITESEALRAAVFNRRLWKATPAISARRSALDSVGGFDETVRRRQDMDLVLRLTVNARCASTDQVLWRKHPTAGAISSKQNTFLAATTEICLRHPDYLTDPRLRRGLERDLGRHFVRLLRQGDVRSFRRDLEAYRRFGRFGASPWRLMLRYLLRRLG